MTTPHLVRQRKETPLDSLLRELSVAELNKPIDGAASAFVSVASEPKASSGMQERAKVVATACVLSPEQEQIHGRGGAM